MYSILAAFLGNFKQKSLILSANKAVRSSKSYILGFVSNFLNLSLFIYLCFVIWFLYRDNFVFCYLVLGSCIVKIYLFVFCYLGLVS